MNDSSKGWKIWSVLYPVGLYMLMNIVASIGGVLVIGMWLMLVRRITNIDYLMTLLFEITMAKAIHLTVLGGFLSVPFFLWFIRNDKKRLKRLELYQEYQKAPLWGYILVAFLGIFLCYSGNNIIIASGLMEIFGGFDAVAEVLYQENLMFELLTIGIFVPYVEELLFRGLVYRRLKELVNVKLAIVLSALFFGVYHFNVVQGIYAFGLGLALAYACEKFHNILAPVIIHAAANCLSVIISETELFVPIYESMPALAVTTVISLGLAILLLIVIAKGIKLKTIDKEERLF